MRAARRAVAIAFVFGTIALTLLIYAQLRLAVASLVLAVLTTAIGLDVLRAVNANRENHP